MTLSDGSVPGKSTHPSHTSPRIATSTALHIESFLCGQTVLSALDGLPSLVGLSVQCVPCVLRGLLGHSWYGRLNMWPVTTTPAAAALGVPAANLRRWIRQGKFDHIKGMTRARRPGTFQEERLFTRKWIEAVARELNVQPDFSKIERQGNV
jgi:hypothetical protein